MSDFGNIFQVLAVAASVTIVLITKNLVQSYLSNSIIVTMITMIYR